MRHSISPRSTILLVCDVQERFREYETSHAVRRLTIAGAAIHGFDAMSSNIAKMIKAAAVKSVL